MKKVGFSIIEMLVVITVVSSLAAGLLVNISESRNRNALDNAQASIVRALEQTRDQSLTGVGKESHGVHIKEDRIIIFEGDHYINGQGQTILLPSSVITDQTDTTIIFDRLNAMPDNTANIILQHENGQTKNIQVTDEGIIIEN